MTDPNLERTIGVLEDSLALRPRDAQQRTRLGEAYQKLGKRSEALAAFRRAVKDERDYAQAHAALGALLAEQGAWDEGEASLREATRLKPDLVAPYITLAQEYARRSEHAKASEAYATALALRPDMVTLLRGAADVALKSKRLDEAARFLALARQQTPDDPEVLLRLGLTTAELGRFPEARDALQAYVALRDKPPEAWVA